jgi:hypothetical protein
MGLGKNCLASTSRVLKHHPENALLSDVTRVIKKWFD